MKILKNIFIFAIVLILSYLSASSAGIYYDTSYRIIEEGFFAIPKRTSILIIGFVLSYIFFSALLFTLFGNSKKYWWIVILLIPAVIFQLYLDAEHIYFPIILGLLGWVIGLGILKIYHLAKKDTQTK